MFLAFNELEQNGLLQRLPRYHPSGARRSNLYRLKGEITKTSCDTIIYTAIFSSMDAVEVSEEDTGNTAEVNWPLILISLGVVGLGAAGYFGRKGYIHYQNKKRGYE